MEGLLLVHDLCSTAESGLSATQGQLITTGNDHDAPFISGATEDAAPRGYHRAIASAVSFSSLRLGIARSADILPLSAL